MMQSKYKFKEVASLDATKMTFEALNQGDFFIWTEYPADGLHQKLGHSSYSEMEAGRYQPDSNMLEEEVVRQDVDIRSTKSQ